MVLLKICEEPNKVKKDQFDFSLIQSEFFKNSCCFAAYLTSGEEV